MAHVINKSSSEITLDNVPVVCKFSDVFFEDLLGPLQKRELEFRIELLSGSTLISILPYRMAPTELKELKT